MNFANYSFSGTYRPTLDETTFLFTLEPTIKNRPIIMLFMVDGSHSMRFYIDEAKTIQRQSLVQAVVQLGINNHDIIQNDDYVGLATFSTEVRSLLENRISLINETSRSELDELITTSLKSDGGQTNYGKAFKYLLETFSEVTAKFNSDSPHLAGPMLVWFLTDGRPWPEAPGNTTEDIMNFATTLGESGNELWIIGISEDANKDFLDKIALSSQHGSSQYNKRLQNLPKEFLLEQIVSEKTLWVDLDISSQEQLIHGLVNAIEGARSNLGIVAEVTIIFLSDFQMDMKFLIGANEIHINGLETIIKMKRFDFLKIGQKMSMALSLHTKKEILMHTKLKTITVELFRGEKIISQETTQYNQPLFTLVKEELKVSKGQIEIKNNFRSQRKSIKLVGHQLQDLTNVLESLGVENTSIARKKLNELEKFL